MNSKQIIKLIGALSMSAPLCAVSEMREPLSLYHSRVMRLKPVTQAWWYDLMPSKKSEECCFSVHKWTSLYMRSAGSAFQDEDSSNKNTTHTASLSTLFFGKDSFKAAEAFPNGKITNIAQLNKFSPLINVAFLTPQYQYTEKGICFGSRVNYRLKDNSNWHVGGLITVPISVVEVIPEASAQVEERLEDLFKGNVITAIANDDGTKVTYTNDMAIRYDLLNSLMLDESTKLLRPDGPNTKIGSLSVDGSVADAGQMYAIKQYNTESPVQPYRKQAAQVTAPLASTGQGGADKVVSFIKTNTDYTNLNTDSNTQATLWVVPRAENTNANALTAQSQAIVNQIQYAVSLADLSNRTVSAFLANQGIFLQNYERKAGLGDLKIALYGCYHDSEDNWFIKVVGGTKAPTGTKRDADEALHLTQLQTGNNRHWELAAELLGGWQPLDWMSFDLSASANHVFAREEWMPASFVGSTVKNIGPAVEGKVSWNYFTAQANFNFFHPHNPELGMTVGYSLFAKNGDHVRYEKHDATDLFGNTLQPLDPDVAAIKTKAMTHAVRAELFHRWNYCEIMAGGSYDIAGRNAMKMTEAHIGFSVYF